MDSRMNPVCLACPVAAKPACYCVQHGIDQRRLYESGAMRELVDADIR